MADKSKVGAHLNSRRKIKNPVKREQHGAVGLRRLERLIGELGQADLAWLMGVDPNDVRRWSGGEVSPSRPVVALLGLLDVLRRGGIYLPALLERRVDVAVGGPL